MTIEKKSKSIVLVDYENIAIPLTKQHKRLEIKKDFLGCVGRVYADDTEVCVVYTFDKFISDTNVFGTYHYRMLNASLAKKNSADITLAVEAIDLAYKNMGNDVHFVFLCGDADYLPVFYKFDTLKIAFTVYALKDTVGEVFKDYFDGESQFGELQYLDEVYQANIVPSVAIKPEHVIVLKQLNIAESISASKGKPVNFRIFQSYLTNAVTEFGRQLTDQEATDLINEVIGLGYVLQNEVPSLQGHPMSVFSLNHLNVQVVSVMV